MQLDKETLNKLLELSDSEFKRKISKAANSAGIQDDKLDKVLDDVKSIKKTLGSLNDAELKRMAQTMSSEQMEQIIKNFRNGGK